MAKPSTADIVVGVLLIIIGILFLLGEVGVPFLQEILAIAAIVVGVLMLMGKVRGAQWMGIALVILGVIMLATSWLDFLTGTLANVINIILGVLLVVFGVLKLMGRK